MELRLGWTEVSAMLTLAAAVSGVALVLIRQALGGSFAGRPALQALERRLGSVETRLNEMPSEDEIRALGNRIGHMERSLNQLSTGHARVEEGVASVRRMVDLLLRHQLGERAGGLVDESR